VAIDQILISLITNTLCTTTILVTLGFLGRTIIDRWIAKDIQKSKIEIEKITNIEIEKIRVSLDIEKFKSEIRFTKFHEKRIEIINEIYNKLTDEMANLRRICNILIDEKAKGQKLTFDTTIGIDETWNYFKKNKIYFREDLATKIENHLIQAMAISALLAASTDLFEQEEWPIQFSEAMSAIKNVDTLTSAKKLLEDLQKDSIEIEKEFRELIGVT
jgi:hypothetical protein